MAEVGFISEGLANQLVTKPLLVNPKNVNIPAYSAYFIDLVKAELEKLLPKEALEQGGFRIKTTLDLEWQKKGYENLINALRGLSKKIHRGGCGLLG